MAATKQQINLLRIRQKIIESTADNNSRLDAVFVVPLKYLNNFCRSLDLRLFNCETELDLSQLKTCITSQHLLK